MSLDGRSFLINGTKQSIETNSTKTIPSSFDIDKELMDWARFLYSAYKKRPASLIEEKNEV